MLHAMVSAALEDIAEAKQIGVDIGERVFQGVADPGLGSQVDHPVQDGTD